MGEGNVSDEQKPGGYYVAVTLTDGQGNKKHIVTTVPALDDNDTDKQVSALESEYPGYTWVDYRYVGTVRDGINKVAYDFYDLDKAEFK